MRGYHGRKAAPGAIITSIALVLIAACSGGGGDLVLGDDIEGFHLGERLGDFKKRVGTSVPWTEIQGSPYDRRGTLLAVTGTPSGSREIEMSRLTFFEDRLMEIVLYYKRNTYSQLETLCDRLVERYGIEPTSPDGSIEMAYKTYWFNLPDMSITIRRITKKPETELYVQYQHRELLRRMKEKAGR
jgi:hypothetical protein